MKKPAVERVHPAGMGGLQKLYFFPNGYGASVIQTPFSYGGERGLWELAVIKGDESKWDLTYETPITGDVLGGLTEERVDTTLDEIAALPSEPASTPSSRS